MDSYILEVKEPKNTDNTGGSKKNEAPVFWAMKKGQKTPLGGPFQKFENANQCLINDEKYKLDTELAEKLFHEYEADKVNRRFCVREVGDGKCIGEFAALEKAVDSAENHTQSNTGKLKIT